MSSETWSIRPKIDELSLTDILMRRVPTNLTALNQEIPVSDVVSFLQGSSIVIIASEADLPPVGADGHHTLEIDKNYLFTEPMVILNPILFPAGWIGTIRKSFLNSTSITYSNTSFSMFRTLDIDGIINSIADSGTEPSVKSTITTSVAHGLLDGQFVNITDTLVETVYSQQSLQISNVTATTFDVEIIFTATDSGNFNTGYGSIQFVDFGAVSPGNSTFISITSAGVPGSSLLFTRFAVAGFISPGIVKNAPNIVCSDSIFAFVGSGLVLENCQAAVIQTTDFLDLGGNPSATGLIIQGVATKAVGVFNSKFTMTNSDQRPARVDSDVTNADEVVFQNSPDNNVADEYFDTALGGLDETNPQVIALNNGIRKNSQTIASAFVNVNTSTTTIVTADTFQDIDFGTLTPSVSIEEFILTNAATCEFEYIGLKPITAPIIMSMTMRKVSGATEIYHIKFVVDKGSGFVDFADNIILPFEVKTDNASGTYVCQAQLDNGDKIKPQISGIGTSDNIIMDTMSINVRKTN